MTKKKTSERVEDRADGIHWLKRFSKAGMSQARKEQLEPIFAAGLPFDLGGATVAGRLGVLRAITILMWWLRVLIERSAPFEEGPGRLRMVGRLRHHYLRAVLEVDGRLLAGNLKR